MRFTKNIITDTSLQNRHHVFEDRHDAGRVLSGLLKENIHCDAILLAIPAGGVPVANVMADSLELSLSLAVTSKMLIPGNSEAGFGAIAFDGSQWLNQKLVNHLQLSNEAIEESRQHAITKVQKRFKQYCQQRTPDIKGKEIILVDDGLASGATLYAAIKALKKLGPDRLIIAIPTGCQHSVASVAPLCDLLVCANIRAGYPYAVAAAYKNWCDVSEQELEKYFSGHLKNGPENDNYSG